MNDSRQCFFSEIHNLVYMYWKVYSAVSVYWLILDVWYTQTMQKVTGYDLKSFPLGREVLENMHDLRHRYTFPDV